jgi:putative zinc finger protein
MRDGQGNQRRCRDDLHSVKCNEWNAAIAALAAGADTPYAADELRAHADGCPACRRRRDAIVLGPAAEPTDLPTRVVKEARRLDRAAVAPLLRAALVVTAAAMLALHLPDLIIGGGHDAGEHAARHAAACPVAFAIALVVVAVRPSRARGLLPVTASLAVALLLTGAIDIARGVTPIVGETDHLIEIAGAVVVWLTARSVSRPAPDVAADRHLHVAPT